jgi:hypothetical protein
MTNEEFAVIDAALMQRCDEILHQRGASYGSKNDRFANFKEIAAETGLTPRIVG